MPTSCACYPATGTVDNLHINHGALAIAVRRARLLQMSLLLHNGFNRPSCSVWQDQTWRRSKLVSINAGDLTAPKCMPLFRIGDGVARSKKARLRQLHNHSCHTYSLQVIRAITLATDGVVLPNS